MAQNMRQIKDMDDAEDLYLDFGGVGGWVKQGCMIVWVYGCMSVWVYGCMGV